MKKNILQKARQLESDIWQTERDIKDIGVILSEYDTFGSTVSFIRNSSGYTRSFGSKKYNFKTELEQLVIRLRNQLEKDLVILKEEFEKL